MNNNQKKICVLAAAMLRIREDVISTAKRVFANDVKKLCSHLIDNDLDVRYNAIVQQGKCKSIFDRFPDKFDDNWEEFMRVTLPIFLSPVILHEAWITEVKKQFESNYRVVILKIDTFDSPRCTDFVQMISHNNIKNMVEKWYSKYLIKFGCKLLTKKPKQNGLLYQTFCINHPNFDTIFIHSNFYILKTTGSFNFVPASHDDPQFDNMSIEKMTSEHGVMNGNDDVSQEDGEYLWLYDDVIDNICKFQTCPHCVVISLYLITFIFYIIFVCIQRLLKLQ
jgi:hypothetical protein